MNSELLHYFHAGVNHFIPIFLGFITFCVIFVIVKNPNFAQ